MTPLYWGIVILGLVLPILAISWGLLIKLTVRWIVNDLRDLGMLTPVPDKDTTP